MKNSPIPVKKESRCCFGISWFATEKEAIEYGAIVHKTGRIVIGGYFHGMPCDRAEQFDYTDQNGKKLYAVRD